MSEPSGDVAGALLAELEADGEFVDAGEFTIDAARARAKLQAFQVADPREYVLLVIEAAVMAGVSPVQISTDSGVHVELGPVDISRLELERWFGAAFVRLNGGDGENDEAERTRRRVLQKLAIASNAALRVARSVEVEVVRAEQRLRLLLDDEHELGRVDELAPDPSRSVGARITVRHRLGAATELDTLIRERCRLSAAEILLDGERVSFGHAQALQVDLGFDELRFGSNALKRRVVRIDGRAIGLAGFRLASNTPAELLILTNGVFAERIELTGDPEWAPGFVAVVELDLTKDLGQAAILRGPEFEQMLAAVRAVHERVAAGRQAIGPAWQAPQFRSLPRLSKGWGYAQLLLAVVLWFGLPTGPNFLAFVFVAGAAVVLLIQGDRP